MNTEIVLNIIFEWQKIVLGRQGVSREAQPHLINSIGSKPIKIVTGFRRTGKSYFLQIIARKLIDEGRFRADNFLYLNFEDYRLMGVVNPEKLGDVYNAFLQSSEKPGQRLLIFDEIQQVADWERFIRTIYEKGDVEIIITGSNSSLLSSELGSGLAGRFVEFAIHPFSFREFLHYRGHAIGSGKEYLRNKQEIQRLFNEYLAYGGLPETFDIGSSDAKKSYLNGILHKVILDDIVKRFKVDNVDALEKIVHYLISGAGNIVSYAGLCNKMAGLGIRVKPETVISYCNYFVKSFALSEVSKFSWKLGRIFSTSKKYYAVDTGLMSLYAPLEENYSLRLEHIVYHELKRRYGEICYGAGDGGREIDFLVRREGRIWEKYQVALHLDKNNERRELGAFALADQYLDQGINHILTLDEGAEEITYAGRNIYRKNVLLWLLGID
jgi:hypothetical protein